jgi:hypothetical protein
MKAELAVAVDMWPKIRFHTTREHSGLRETAAA